MCREGRLYDVERWIAEGKPLQLAPEAIPKGTRPKTALQIALEGGQHSLAALLLSSGSSPEIIRRQVESSFGQYQNLKRICRVEDEARKLEASLAEARAYDAPCGDFSRIGRYRALRQEVAEHRRREGRERGRRPTTWRSDFAIRARSTGARTGRRSSGCVASWR